jgi:hypothetical protein
VLLQGSKTTPTAAAQKHHGCWPAKEQTAGGGVLVHAQVLVRTGTGSAAGTPQPPPAAAGASAGHRLQEFVRRGFHKYKKVQAGQLARLGYLMQPQVLLQSI